MRFPSVAEKEFIFELLKMYIRNVYKFTVTKWWFYDDMHSRYVVSVNANGLTDWMNKPLPDNYGVAVIINKKKFNKWISDNDITIPEFELAEILCEDKFLPNNRFRKKEIKSPWKTNHTM